MAVRLGGALDRKFDILERRARQQAKAGTQEQQDAIARRFASLGTQGTGEQLKLEQQALERGAKREREAIEGINMLRLEEQGKVESEQRARDFASAEAEKQRVFSGGESEKQRGFAGEQARLSREFATQERLGTEKFNSQLAALGREFTREERQFSEAFKQALFNEEFAETVRINNFNMEQAKKAWDQPGMMESIIEELIPGSSNRAKQAEEKLKEFGRYLGFGYTGSSKQPSLPPTPDLGSDFFAGIGSGGIGGKIASSLSKNIPGTSSINRGLKKLGIGG